MYDAMSYKQSAKSIGRRAKSKEQKKSVFNNIRLQRPCPMRISLSYETSLINIRFLRVSFVDQTARFAASGWADT
jgi:hypothetical protein